MPDCRDCQHWVSKSAQTCPECGAHKPAMGRTEYWIDRVILLVCVLVVVLGALVLFVL